jgi:hypothetical protein
MRVTGNTVKDEDEAKGYARGENDYVILIRHPSAISFSRRPGSWSKPCDARCCFSTAFPARP